MTQKKVVAKGRIPELAAELRKAAKSPPVLSFEATVMELREPIQEMIEAGYGYEEIAQKLGVNGMDISAASLKKYHRKYQLITAREEKKEPGTGKPQTGAEASAEPQSDADMPQEAPAAALPQEDGAVEAQEPESKTAPATGQDRKPGSSKKTQKSAAASRFNVTDRSEL